MPHVPRLSAADTALLVIDVQEKLMVKVPDAAAIVRNIAFLIDAAQLLKLPVLCTEQYPKGLGPTVAELAKRLPDRPAKTGFSCCAVPSVVETLHREVRPKVVLAGIEAHVCVLHTAIDLLDREFHVFIAVDAVGSRYAVDRDFALRRLECAGAVLTTCETVVFECLRGAEHPSFKAASALIQERMKATI